MSKTILVVDDSSSFRTVVKLVLRKAGFDVQEAVDGQDATDKLGTVKPHLIVCEVNLPRLDGLSFARQVKANPTHQSTPIIMLTAESHAAKKAEGRAAGVQGWITKPFQPSQLIDAVTRLCA